MNEKHIIFKKKYDTDAPFLITLYLRTLKNKVLYETECGNSLYDNSLEDIYGIYCLKCGHLEEYPKEEYVKVREKGTFKPCKCGRKISWDDLLFTNGSARDMKTQGSLYQAIPKALTISEQGERINISVIFRNWKFNAKAGKPYRRDFQITVVINTVLGQTYIMPAKWKGKDVFLSDHIQTASLLPNGTLNHIDTAFFKNGDGESIEALKDALGKARPEIRQDIARCNSLESLCKANYLGELFKTFPEENASLAISLNVWKRLKRRYVKNPATFPDYLTYGCKEVATKSVKRVLYKYPEQKWTLRFLYKILGITDPNILRTLLEDRTGNAAKLADRFMETPAIYDAGHPEKLKQIRHLADALSEAGMTDKQKASFFITDDYHWHEIRDSARMYAMHERRVPASDLIRFRTINELHDYLADIDIKMRDKLMWDRYHQKISYDKEILDLEGPLDNAEFRVIKTPWDLKELGRRFHNCVGSYMEDVKQKHSIIIEMLLNGKSAACIELNREGDVCRQAFAACNQRLEGDAAEKFNKWTKRHGITPGELVPRAAERPLDIRAWDERFFAAPF